MNTTKNTHKNMLLLGVVLITTTGCSLSDDPSDDTGGAELCTAELYVQMMHDRDNEIYTTTYPDECLNAYSTAMKLTESDINATFACGDDDCSCETYCNFPEYWHFEEQPNFWASEGYISFPGHDDGKGNDVDYFHSRQCYSTNTTYHDCYDDFARTSYEAELRQRDERRAARDALGY